MIEKELLIIRGQYLTLKMENKRIQERSDLNLHYLKESIDRFKISNNANQLSSLKNCLESFIAKLDEIIANQTEIERLEPLLGIEL